MNQTRHKPPGSRVLLREACRLLLDALFTFYRVELPHLRKRIVAGLYGACVDLLFIGTLIGLIGLVWLGVQLLQLYWK